MLLWFFPFHFFITNPSCSLYNVPAKVLLQQPTLMSVAERLFRAKLQKWQEIFQHLQLKDAPPNAIKAASLPFHCVEGWACNHCNPWILFDRLKLSSGPASHLSLPKSRSSGFGFQPRKPEAQLPAPGAPKTAGAQARKREVCSANILIRTSALMMGFTGCEHTKQPRNNTL